MQSYYVNKREKNNKQFRKILKMKAMKTRIFNTVMIVILTTSLFAGATNSDKKDSTSVLAYTATEKANNEYNPSNAGFTANSYSVSNADLLENWISSRESWEQESPETEAVNYSFEKVDLDGWISGRETWEQASDPANTAMVTIILEEWVSGRASWEQEGNTSEHSTFSYRSNILAVWISEMDNWEQK
jgi:hypothetical protein